MATASSVSRSTSATRSGWNTAWRRAAATPGSAVEVTSDRLEVVEGLAAGAADPQRLAGRGPEPAQLPGVGAAALRAAHGEGDGHGPLSRRTSGRRGDAVVGELAPAIGRHPVRGPGRGQEGG